MNSSALSFFTLSSCWLQLQVWLARSCRIHQMLFFATWKKTDRNEPRCLISDAYPVSPEPLNLRSEDSPPLGCGSQKQSNKGFWTLRPIILGGEFSHLRFLGNIPVITTTKIFTKVLRYKWETYCNTNGGRTAIQMGGILTVLPFPQSVGAPKVLQ